LHENLNLNRIISESSKINEGEKMSVTKNVQELVEKYSDLILRIAYQNCFNKSDSEDIAQEVFIKIMKNINSFSNDEYLKSWIIRVTINLCKDYNKGSWYKKVEQIDENLSEYYFDSEDKEVFQKLQKLKPVYRNTIYLYYYEGYKISEIAQILNLKENTVSSNLTRARMKLKGILEKEDEAYEK
jgi:RNA polymerase sigma-70 factor (ECF subfamily)